MWMRSATSKTWGMLWLMRIDRQAAVADVADQLQDLA